MKRLVITGLACPPEPWKKFLGDSPEQRIIPIREVFRNTSSSDPRELSRYITKEIEAFGPQSLICHDMGVPLTLLSLLRLNRQGKCLDTRVTLFNGAFRRVNLFKANHPFRIQVMGIKKAIRELKARGGKVDYHLASYLSRIRAMFRMIIIYGMSEKIGCLIGLDGLVGFSDRYLLTAPIQIIASRNDPFIPFDSILQLKRDIRPKKFYEIEYGHFPYTADPSKILPLIEEFEFEGAILSGKKGESQDIRPSRMLL